MDRSLLCCHICTPAASLTRGRQPLTDEDFRTHVRLRSELGVMWSSSLQIDESERKTVWSSRPDHHRGTTQHNITPHHRAPNPPRLTISGIQRVLPPRTRQRTTTPPPTGSHRVVRVCVCATTLGRPLGREGRGAAQQVIVSIISGAELFRSFCERIARHKETTLPLPFLSSHTAQPLAPFSSTYGPPRGMPRGGWD